MKIHLTAQSERGKPVTKSGNDELRVVIRGEDREVLATLLIIDDSEDTGDYRMRVETSEKVWLETRDTKPKTAREHKHDIVRDDWGKEYCQECGTFVFQK